MGIDFAVNGRELPVDPPILMSPSLVVNPGWRKRIAFAAFPTVACSSTWAKTNITRRHGGYGFWRAKPICPPFPRKRDSAGGRSSGDSPEGGVTSEPSRREFLRRSREFNPAIRELCGRMGRELAP